MSFKTSLKDVSILHVCGGDPLTSHKIPKMTGYSPRMWRWSFDGLGSGSSVLVFSTYVEVILWWIRLWVVSLGILHVCGGDPTIFLCIVKHIWYSPRMWRWSLQETPRWQYGFVFSTYVEVIPENHILKPRNYSILHVCGGDPIFHGKTRKQVKYSPRMWRWSWH